MKKDKKYCYQCKKRLLVPKSYQVGKCITCRMEESCNSRSVIEYSHCPGCPDCGLGVCQINHIVTSRTKYPEYHCKSILLVKYEGVS